VKPLKLILTLCELLPVLVKTVTKEPSRFLNAPKPTPLIVPDVERRTAPGRTNLDHIAKAQRRPDGVTVVPSLATRYDEAWNSLTSTPSQYR